MVNAHPIKVARDRSRRLAPTSGPGYCLREVRECYGLGPNALDATEAWNEAKHRHPVTHGVKDIDTIPRGVPVFWVGGSHNHGHIAIATGYDAMCWSTDIRRPGYFDHVPIEEIEDKWGLTLVGWTEDLNGVRVYADAKWEEPAK